jgi:hypothetical protein
MVVLKKQVDARVIEMQSDDKAHYLIYHVLGVSASEGDQIDLYQNKGRFLYKYAGTFLENAVKMCFEERFPDAAALKIPNTLGSRPKIFEIDCLVNNDAYEVKWRDATTDGDHITKEHTRLKVISAANFTPIRLMFYFPNRRQAIRIQAVLEDLYKAVGGKYYHGIAAWDHLTMKSGVDLLTILNQIAEKRGLS